MTITYSLPDIKAHITPRELEIMLLCAAGLNNNRIADKLVLSVKTVEKHINNLYLKMGAHSKLHLVLLAIKLNMISIDDTLRDMLMPDVNIDVTALVRQHIPIGEQHHIFEYVCTQCRQHHDQQI